jgi:hypothetical protein
MSGLLEKADRGREEDQQETGPGSRAADSGISLKEREEILAQIEEAVAKTRTPAGDHDLSYQSERSGALLPIVVNAIAILVIAAGALLFSWFFNRSEQLLTSGSAPVLTAESKVVDTIKRESEQKLAGKDKEIADIQGRLSEIGGQLSALKSDSVEKIRRREEELRAALAAELAAEREKLGRAGASTKSIDQQVQLTEDRKTKELNTALAAFRRQADAELARKETEINARFSEYQRSLEEARAEKTRLQEEMAAQREDLLAKAKGDTAKLAEALGSLREQQQKEQLVADQVSASYRLVDAEMAAGRWDGSIGALDSLAGYLDQPAIAALPAVQRRKPVELFLIASLRGLVASRRGGAAAPAADTTAADLVDRAEERYRAGDFPAARDSYLAAIRSVPSLRAVPDRLAAVEETGRAATRKAVADAIAAGEALHSAGDYKGANEKYGKALEAFRDVTAALPRLGVRIADAGWRQGLAELVAREDRSSRPLVEKADRLARAGSWSEAITAYAGAIRAYPNSTLAPRALAGMESSIDGLLKKKDEQAAQKERELSLTRKQAEEGRKASVDEKLQAVSEGLAASGRRVGTSASVAQKELIDLLEAKVKMKEVLGSAAVAAQYPGLAGKLDRYLDLFGEEKRTEGRAFALRDVGVVVDYIQGKKTRDDVTALLDRYAADAPLSAFQQILDRLRGLFQ